MIRGFTKKFATLTRTPAACRMFGGAIEKPLTKPYKRTEGVDGYYIDPENVAVRLSKLIAGHPGVKNVGNITLNSTWFDLGVCDFDKTEILLEAELEFDIEIADENIERFADVNDVVEHISRSFHAH